MISLSTPNTISGRSAFIELLQSEGVTHLFGNPGTTELPIMHALADYPDMRYVLGVQEAIVVAMVDGYARASGEQTLRHLHACSGRFRLERSPGGACTRWKRAALSRRTWLPDRLVSWESLPFTSPKYGSYRCMDCSKIAPDQPRSHRMPHFCLG